MLQVASYRLQVPPASACACPRNLQLANLQPVTSFNLSTWNLQPLAVEAPAAPATDTEIDWRLLAERFPPYRVILHNDDVHSKDYVVAALRKSVSGLRARKAILIMLEAHLTGRATVVVCPREQAELYAERLGTFGLTVTIEPER